MKPFLLLFWLYNLEGGIRHFQADEPSHHELLAVTFKNKKIKLF